MTADPSLPINSSFRASTIAAGALILGIGALFVLGIQATAWGLLPAMDGPQALSQRLAALMPQRWGPVWASQWSNLQAGSAFEAALHAGQCLIVFGFWLLAVMGWGQGTALWIRRISGSEHVAGGLWARTEEFSLGLVSLGLLVFISGLVWCSPIPILLAGAVGAALAIWARFGKLTEKPIGRSGACAGLYPGGITLWFVLGIFLLTVAVASLAPPIQSDAMRYHLAAPQEWLRLGRITPLPLNAFSGFPFLPGMHFLFATAAGVASISAAMHALAYLACVVVVGSMTVQGVLPRHRTGALWVVYILALTIPCGAILSTWPFVDHFLMLFTLLAARSVSLILSQNPENRNARHEALLLGVWIGGMLCSKYTALPMLVALVGALLVCGILAGKASRSAMIRAIWTQLPWVIVPLFLAGSPWYIRNLIHYGNPLYPALTGLLGGGDWTADSARMYAAKLAEKGDSISTSGMAGLLTPLWNTSLDWVRFEAHFLGGHGPVILLGGLAAGFLTVHRRWKTGLFPRPHRMIIPIWGGGMYLAWAATYQSNRMLLPVLFLLLPVTIALLVNMLSGSAGWVRWAARLGIGLIALHGGLWAVQWCWITQPNPPLPMAVGAQSRTAYLNGALNYHSAYDHLGNQSAAGLVGVVLHHGEHRIAYARHRALWGDWFDTPPMLHVIRSSQARTVADLRGALIQRNISHVLVNDGELALQVARYFRPRFSESEWVLSESLLATLSLEWGEAGKVRILRVQNPPTGRTTP